MRKVRASQCSVEEVELPLAQEFIDTHHSQKSASTAKALCLGLFLGEELLGVIQFVTPRSSLKKRLYTVELLRLCFKTSVRVHGGASKLINFYKENYSPVDFFTYQTTVGLATNVYKACGMSLVSEAKEKQYLVAPGFTLATAPRKKYYSIGEASRRGPDALLGTKLGEVFREDGKRKTNPELFIEELGWHLETTRGDRVWEWFNPNVSFYTYKITATDSDKYYYGVRQINLANPTVEDCLDDPYLGSGGSSDNNKFSNWKAKHQANLVKEVIQIHSSKSSAYEHERKLVKDLWKTDPLCLNSIPGGQRSFKNHFPGVTISFKECPIHGISKHRGDTCYSCFKRSLHYGECSIHGQTKFNGAVCCKCSSSKRDNLKLCSIHGLVMHSGDICYTCNTEKQFSEKRCELHGVVKFRGENCLICARINAIELKDCPIHGTVNHQGPTCLKCMLEKRTKNSVCKIHGPCKHLGSKCYLCLAEKRTAMKNCVTHGLTKHVGEACFKCSTANSYHNAFCEIHGETKHRGAVCCRCHTSASMKEKLCDIHGVAKHRGDACLRCSAAKRVHKKHQEKQDNCFLCAQESKVAS